MNKLYCLAYLSILSEKEGPLSINDIIKQSRRNNSDNQITGILIYDGSHIFQYIEGMHDQIQILFNKIKQDSRHTDVIKLFDIPLDRPRRFEKWSMGFSNLDESSFLKNLNRADMEYICQQLDIIHKLVDIEP